MLWKSIVVGLGRGIRSVQKWLIQFCKSGIESKMALGQAMMEMEILIKDGEICKLVCKMKE